MVTQTPIENEDNPQTFEGTGGEQTPETNPSLPSSGLTREEREELEKLRRQFPESSQEAIRLAKRVKELEGKLDEASEALSEKELLMKNPEYEFMDEDEKERFKADMEKEKRIKVLEAKQQMREDYGALPEGIKKRIELNGGFDVFRDFACSSDNVGQKNLLNVAKAFLYEKKKEESPTPVEEKKPGLEIGTGGERISQPKEEGFTATDMRHIREKEPERYAQLARDHKLKLKK